MGIKISIYWRILFAIVCLGYLPLYGNAQNNTFEFYDGTFNYTADSAIKINVSELPNEKSVLDFYHEISVNNYQPIVATLLNYKAAHQLNDWIFYQLIRKTAEDISPKKDNYFRYTLYKWFLLSKCGYDAKIAIGNNQIIFYVRNEEEISDIPFFMIVNKKYTCLNYHDYGRLFERENAYKPVTVNIPEAKNSFSYKIDRMPDFRPTTYEEKDLSFNFQKRAYHFKLKVNPDVKTIFANYPGVDFESYFNIPLSRETYSSLIPVLKQNVKNMSQKKGVDYLMRFTRYAFLYENDDENFGKEKRLSPEQTLLNDYSDCDDRVALFFFLVKEIYNLPMIAMLYPTHITMAVAFDKPLSKSIIYNGKKYAVCEPTPQKQDLKLGEISNKLKNVKYEVVYNYEPK